MNRTDRTALIRNILVSGTNGAITLTILLIAPLGLAAVIMNTALVVVATVSTAPLADQVILFLQGDRPGRARVSVLLDETESDQIRRRS
ncbi:CRISPR-associated protein Csx18 [Prochlorothrix hollandica]|uniref:CRISPR-associated protein Csx18 n=1 Tax=Prochlorothrix hollandica TaxID=1223 RepID=UPI0033427FFA